MPLTGPDVTRKAVVEQSAGRSVLHLATHGVANGRWPHLSYLALAGTERLSVGDLMAAAMGTDLVVLSACRTADGRPTAGGDIVGLMRAALVGGSAHLIASLWPVDDLTGCLFAADVAKRIAGGTAVADAVYLAREAIRVGTFRDRLAAYAALQPGAANPEPAPGRRDLSAQLPVERQARPDHPFFWAPFIHVGI